jgi:GH43 family beta-xylosidase
MGDNDYIIAVINEKIVFYSKNMDKYESLLLDLFLNNTLKEKNIMTDSTLKISDIIETSSSLDIKCERGKQISVMVTLLAEKSAPTIVLDKNGDGKNGYCIEITQNVISLYKLNDGNRIEYARKYVDLEVGKAYKAQCAFDGVYIRFYLGDEPEGYTSWPKFEAITGGYSDCSVSLCEATGFGATFDGLCLEDYTYDVSGEKTYQNVVLGGYADPDIIYHDGYYYMYVTSTGYLVYRSKDLATWECLGQSLPSCSWNINTQYQWAPDVEYVNGKFYMAVSYGEAGFGIAVSDKPEGPFVCVGEKPMLIQTIDGNIFVDDNGKIYLYYTSWYDGRTYGIWGVEMESDCITPKWDTEKLIIRADKPWESSLNMGGVVEAPFMMKKDGVYYLIYSGSNYQADYAVGYATSDSPLGKFQKSENSPILYRTNDVRGPGHCSIVETPDGRLFMVYHVHSSETSVHPRNVAIDPVRFVKLEDGSYRIEAYGPTTSKIPLSVK